MMALLANSGGSGGVAVDLMVILLVAAMVATVFARVKLEAIPGYLVAGALVGPHALGLVSHGARVEQISQLAVVLLMFSIGLHLDAAAIGRGMVHILAIGIASTAAFIAMAFPALRLLGLSQEVSLAVSMALSLSSTAIFVRMVGARREMRAVHARVGLGVSIVQDLLAVVMLAVLPFLTKTSGTRVKAESSTLLSAEWIESLPSWAEVLARAGIGVGGIILLILIARKVLPMMLRWVSRTGSSELMLVFSGAVALAAAIGTSLLGFSAEMGAFLAGFLLASTPFRHQLSGQFAPMRDILMAVFFTAVGLQVDPHVIGNHALAVALGCLGLTAAKVVSLSVCSWALGLSPRAAWLTGVYLGNSGEFSLVVIAAASALGLISPELNGLVIATVIASLVVSPLLVEPAHRMSAAFSRLPLAPWIWSTALRTDHHHAGDHPGEEGEESEHHGPDAAVVIAGFGPVGRAIADRLEVANVPIVIVELNPNTVERQAKLGKRRIVYGDVTNPEVLESAGVMHAKAVIMTIPDEQTSLRACREARRMNSTAFIAVRTSFLSGMFQATQLGADHVTVEELATADAMQREVVAQLRKRGIVGEAKG